MGQWKLNVRKKVWHGWPLLVRSLMRVHTTSLSHAQPSMPPGRERLLVGLEFLVTDTFLIWNVRWAIKSQSTQLKVATSSKCKMAALTFIQFANFVRKREHCRSALCSFKDWATTNLLTNTLRRFASLCEGRMKSTTPFTTDWSFDGRNVADY